MEDVKGTLVEMGADESVAIMIPLSILLSWELKELFMLFYSLSSDSSTLNRHSASLCDIFHWTWNKTSTRIQRNEQNEKDRKILQAQQECNAYFKLLCSILI